MRGSRYSPSRRLHSSKRYTGVPSWCFQAVSSRTAGRNFLGRSWKTRQSVFRATTSRGGTLRRWSRIFASRQPRCTGLILQAKFCTGPP